MPHLYIRLVRTVVTFWYTNIYFQTYSCDVKPQCQLSLIQWECWVMSVKRIISGKIQNHDVCLSMTQTSMLALSTSRCGTSPTNWWDMLCYPVMSQTVCLSRIISVWWMFCWLVGLSSAHCCPSQCLSTLFPRHLTSSCASFVTEDDARTDMWKHVAKSDRLLKKYAGDVFTDIQLDEGLHFIVDKDVTARRE